MKSPPNLKTPAEALKEISDILAAIACEAGHVASTKSSTLPGALNKTDR